MNLSNSECSSGCESGWTVYFDQYSDSHQDHQYYKTVEEETLRSKRKCLNDDDIGQEDDKYEDSSMVSDASSGPPHLHEDEKCFIRNEYISYNPDQTKVNQKEQKGIKREDDGKSHLDDTASSPIGIFSKEKSTLSNQFSFLKTYVTTKGASEKPAGELQVKKWQ